MWGPARVGTRVPPEHGTHLVAWGRDPAGRWWALLVWERHVARGFEAPRQVWCSGWAACEHVDRVEAEDYSRVPRVLLDTDAQWWAPPLGPPGLHYGALEPNSALDPPDGLRWCAPRFSKRR